MGDYSETKIISIQTSLSPENMNKNYMSHLYRNIDKDYAHKCHLEHGLILNILRIDKIVSHYITDMIPNASFILNVCIQTYQPKIGHVLNISVDKILHHGLFCNIFSKIRIFIPFSYIPQYVYTKDFTSSYLELVDKKSSVIPKTIRKDDIIPVILKEVRYEKDSYNCLAEIVSK